MAWQHTPRSNVRRQQRPMIIRHARLCVGENSPLLERGHDVHQDGRLDVVRGIVVDDHSMANSCSTIVAAPDDLSLLAIHVLQSFHDEFTYAPFVRLGRQGRETIAWKFDDEEGDLVFEEGNDLCYNMSRQTSGVGRINKHDATCNSHQFS